MPFIHVHATLLRRKFLVDWGGGHELKRCCSAISIKLEAQKLSGLLGRGSWPLLFRNWLGPSKAP